MRGKNVGKLKKFGKNLAKLRTSKFITQEKLAEITNLTPNYIGLIERGLRNPSLSTIINLSIALGENLQTLL